MSKAIRDNKKLELIFFYGKMLVVGRSADLKNHNSTFVTFTKMFSKILKHVFTSIHRTE